MYDKYAKKIISTTTAIFSRAVDSFQFTATVAFKEPFRDKKVL